MQDIKAQTARGVLLDGALFKCVNAGVPPRQPLCLAPQETWPATEVEQMH